MDRLLSYLVRSIVDFDGRHISCVCASYVCTVVCVHHQVPAAGVENLDLTEVIKSNHFNYNRKMPEILELLDLDNCSKYVGRGDPLESEGSSSAAAGAGVGAASEPIVFGTTIVP